MDLVRVSSSNIERVGYDSTKEILVVQFKNGSYYQYEGMDEKMYDNMMRSASIGRYFHSYVKNNLSFKKINIDENHADPMGM